MKTNLKTKTLFAAVAVAVASMAGTAQAASGTDTSSPYSVAAPVNFAIQIPGFLYFRVGAVATTNTMTFAVPAANVGNSSPVAPSGGDALGGTAVNVEVRGNNGQVTIQTTVAAATGLGTGTASDGYIDYAQITTTSSDGTNLPAPVLANSGIPNVTPVLGGGPSGAGKVTNRSATWTYAYLNTTTPSAGNYSGSATYTAVMP